MREQPRSSELAELRQAVLLRLMERRQFLDPFGFLVYAELADAELSPIRPLRLVARPLREEPNVGGSKSSPPQRLALRKLRT